VNPLLLTRNVRSKNLGVSVYGVDRGCKTLVVPPSSSGSPYDELDAQLIGPLFKRNPSLEYLFLSRDCIPIVTQLAPYLSQLRSLKSLAIPGWDNAAAIHKVVMACKNCEVVDTTSLDMSRSQDWNNEASVQALSTLIEMHPKLRCVLGSRAYLTQWYRATLFSRCRFNVALMFDTCEWSLLFSALWGVVCIYVVSQAIYRSLALLKLIEDGTKNQKIAFLAVFPVVVGFDHFKRKQYGRLWTHCTKVVVTTLYRLKRR
jgi:hypothetical protein